MKKTYRFKVANSYTKSFLVSASLGINLPFVNPTFKMETSFSSTKTFSFEDQFEETHTVNQNILAQIPPKTRVILKQIAYTSEQEVPFTAKVTFSNIATQ